MALRVMDAQPVGERELLRLAGQLLTRVTCLERRVRELEEWLEEIGEDVAGVGTNGLEHREVR